MNGTNGNEPGYPENALVPYPVIVAATRVERRSGYSHPPSRSVFPSKSFRMNAPCSYTA